MKTLIFSGSPHKDGDTAGLINLVTAKLEGEYKTVSAYFDDISPCIDCRFCWKNKGCALNDEMQQVYSYIEECDNIIIASPVYFSEITGKLLDVASRLQMYYCSKQFRNESLLTKSKKGAVILVGGGDGSTEKACGTARILLHQMNCTDIYEPLVSHNTNICPAIEDKNVIEKINGLAEFLNN